MGGIFVETLDDHWLDKVIMSNMMMENLHSLRKIGCAKVYQESMDCVHAFKTNEGNEHKLVNFGAKTFGPYSYASILSGQHTWEEVGGLHPL